MLKPQLKQLHFPHEADHVIRYRYEIRHIVYHVTVRSHTSCSSTNENQVYLCVPTEQRRLVVEGTRKILQLGYTDLFAAKIAGYTFISELPDISWEKSQTVSEKSLIDK